MFLWSSLWLIEINQYFVQDQNHRVIPDGYNIKGRSKSNFILAIFRGRCSIVQYINTSNMKFFVCDTQYFVPPPFFHQEKKKPSQNLSLPQFTDIVFPHRTLVNFLAHLNLLPTKTAAPNRATVWRRSAYCTGVKMMSDPPAYPPVFCRFSPPQSFISL